jgi:hypothetical protein
MSKEAFFRVSKWNGPSGPSEESHLLAVETHTLDVSVSDCSTTMSYGQQKRAVCAPEEIKKDKRVLLARKVGSKIDQLVSQLFEENTSSRVSI